MNRTSTLRNAARKVAAELLAGAPNAGIGQELIETLEDLVQVVEAEADGKKYPPLMARAAVAPLLSRLQAEVLRGWSLLTTPPPAPEMLALLTAFERVADSLRTGADEALTTALSAAQGPALMVEFAHDLRSPLTSILFLSDTLRSGMSGEVSPLQQRQLGIIYSAALSLVSMANDVIELLRSGDRSLEKSPSPFSMAELLDSICDVVRPMAEEKSLTVRIESPPVDQRLGYPVPLSRVLLNLTTNALKFTRTGFIEISARSASPSRVEFSVRDTGPGLDKGTIDQMYEPLLHDPLRLGFHLSGSGLGLRICRKLTAAMGSELKFETAEGWGTRFYFELDLPPVGR